MLAFEPSLWSKLIHAVQSRVGRFRLGDLYHAGQRSYRRRFHRHLVGDLGIVSLEISGKCYKVVNMSYGGLHLSLDEGLKSSARHGQIVEAYLIILGISYPLRLRFEHAYKESIGLSYTELDVLEEQYLASFLYFMDAGFVLKSAAKHAVPAQYSGPDWLAYSSLRGAVEVYLRMERGKPIEEAHVYYLNGMRQDFAIFTPQSLMIACNPNREMSVKEKQEILVHVICVLIGLRQVGKTNKLDALMEQALQRLNRSQKLMP